MGQFIRIAVRNLVKHRTRTLIIGGAIAAVTTMLVLLLSLTAGIQKTILDNAAAMASGHVNVAGFYKVSQTSAQPLVTNYKPVLELVKKEITEAEHLYVRTKNFGKVISDTNSITVPMWGVDWSNEERIIGNLPVVEGRLDSLATPGNIVIFAQHAKKLGVKVGDTVTLSMPTLRNVYNTLDVKIGAILADMGMMSSFTTFMHVDDSRRIYKLAPDTTGQIMIFLKDVSKVPEVEEKLRKLLAANGHELMDKEAQPYWMKFDRVAGESWVGQRIDVTTWQDETSFIKWVLDLLGAITFIATTVLLIIVILGLMNTLVMAIRERTSEIGTLRAIGLQRRQVLRMFLLEALILSVASVLVGVVLGAVIVGFLNALDIPITSEAFQFFLMSNVLTLDVRAGDVVTAFVAICLFLTAGAFFPSYRASKMKPISAINHV